MPEFPVILGSGVETFEGVGLFVGDDGNTYYQDSDGNRIQVGAALAGAVTAEEGFLAVGHLSWNDGSDGGYVSHTPLLISTPEAIVFACGAPDADDMQPGNFALSLDLEGGALVVTALDDDGNKITGTVALA